MTLSLAEYLNARYDEEGLAPNHAKRAIVVWTLTHSNSTDPNNYVESQYANPTDSVVLRILVQQYVSRSDFNPDWRM